MTQQQSHIASGLFITFEGGEGAGKTTHSSFLARTLINQGYEVVSLREPGGTNVGEQLRSLVLDPANEGLNDYSELFIYEAARAQLVAKVIRPALERGAVVLCDRFADSTVAYQAYGRGIAKSDVEQANACACQGVWPHRTLLMKTGGCAQEGLTRATLHQKPDRLEQESAAFHERVNRGFDLIAQQDPKRVRVIVSKESKSHTSRDIFKNLVDLFPWMQQCLEQPDFFAPLDLPKENKTYSSDECGLCEHAK